MIYYVSITKTIFAKNLIEIFIKKIIKFYNIFASIIID